MAEKFRLVEEFTGSFNWPSEVRSDSIPSLVQVDRDGDSNRKGIELNRVRRRRRRIIRYQG